MIVCWPAKPEINASLSPAWLAWAWAELGKGKIKDITVYVNKDKIKKSVQEVSAEEQDSRYKNFKVHEISKHFAEVIPADELKKRCLGCLQTTHRWKGNFSGCPPACPFCGTKFDSTNGHCAPECKKLPKTPAAIFKVVDA